MKAKVKAGKVAKAAKIQPEKKGQKDGGRKMKTENSTEGNEGEMEVKWVLRKSIQPDAGQPRKEFNQEKLAELAASMKAQGQQVPLLVAPASDDWFVDEGVQHSKPPKKFFQVLQRSRIKNGAYEGPEPVKYSTKEEAAANLPKWEIVFGERRWRAAELAGMERMKVTVADTSSPDWEKRKLAMQVAENQCRENLSALEEARAYGREIESGRHTAESLYQALGISRGTLFGRLALNRLRLPIREALVAGRINTSVAGLIAQIPGEEGQKELLKEITEDHYGDGPMSFRAVQQHIEKEYVRQLKEAPFDPEAAYKLAPGMVADLEPEHRGCCIGCQACPRRSGNMADEFPELAKRPNVCTDVECFEAKWEAEAKLKVAAAKAAGKKVLEGTAAAALFQKTWNGDFDLKGSTGMVDLSTRCEPLGYEYKNHWKAALKGELEKLEVTLALAPNGELRELVKLEEAEKGLKAAGHKLESHGNGRRQAKSAGQLETERKEREAEKIRKAECDAIAAAIVAKVEGMKDFGAEWLWNMAAQSLMDLAGFYVMQPIEKRRGWEKGGHYSEAHDNAFGKMTLKDRVGLAMEVATSRDEDMQNIAIKELGLDVKGIAKAAREELEKPKEKTGGGKRKIANRK